MKYRIGDVKRILGIPVETLRFFEKKEIINPQRDENNSYRYYDALDINKLVAYKFYRSMEFSVKESADIVNSLSHFESVGQLERQLETIRRKITHYEYLLMRMKELKHSLEQIEVMQGRFRIEDSPEILIYCNQVNDTFGMDALQREVTRKWLNQLPFVWLALFIPKEEIPYGEVVQWGYALRTVYHDIAEKLDLPLTRRIPPQKSVFTIFKVSGDEILSPRKMQVVLRFMEENGLVLNGDAIGSIINEEHDNSGISRYFEVWLPVADK
ncbi:MAG: MerR family transcriptional regulator [Clostridiales bacterium]|nr:MerR family transcriptional regulator [Eubacteriales bacterium]MDH7567880.1 MerR family transcriptional regulator [Clostridiales bacterium]